MKKQEIYRIIDEAAPLKYAEDWDNCGVQIDVGGEEVNTVLCAMEINDAVINEAVEKKAELIVTHHPLIFDGLKNLDQKDIPARYVIRLVQAGISVLSAHTCFDVADGGINDCLADLLGLENVSKACEMIPGVPETMLFRVGDLPEPMKLRDCAVYVRSRLPWSPGLRIAGDPEKIIKKVCVCGGSGGSYWNEALETGADLYVTGEIKHHDAGPASDSGLAVIEASHAATECSFAGKMADILRQAAAEGLTVLETESCVEPFAFSI